jgi:hypothetical protein
LIFLFFIVRLIGITNPPIETGHGWRQAFTCTVARNFLEEDSNILYPRINLAGNQPDIVACEFPLFNYLIFLVSKVFGYQHWYGRLINLLFSSAGVYCFYLLCRKFFGERTGYFAGIILLSSVWFSFSRKIMPDTFSVSLVLMGLYFFSRYLDSDNLIHLSLFILFSALGGMSKIPSTILLSLAFLPVLQDIHQMKKKMIILGSLLSIILLISSWYFFWVPYLLRSFKNQLFFPREFLAGLKDLFDYGYWTMDKFIFVALHSFVALFFFITGIYQAVRQRNRLIILIFCSTLPLQLFFMIKAGYVFSTHDYYIIPYVPVMAMIAGFGLASIPWKKIAYIFAVCILIEGVANQHHDFWLKKSNLFLVNLEQVADKVSQKNDLIAITGDVNPQEMYFAHRKGWGLSNDELQNPGYLDNLKRRGCKYLFVNRHSFDVPLPYKIIFRDTDYTIYQL